MPGTRSVTRAWVQEILPEEVRMRCSYHRRGRRMTQYTVQLEIRLQDAWQPVVRYDNAHGFCHRDTIHPDGTQDKTTLFVGGANDNFTLAIKEVQTNWEAQRSRFLEEIKP